MIGPCHGLISVQIIPGLWVLHFEALFDDFKKIFSGPEIRFKLLMQFSQARRDESIDISECRKYYDFR